MRHRLSAPQRTSPKTQGGIGKALRNYSQGRESLYVSMKVEPEENGYDATRRNLDELKVASWP